MKQPGIQIQCKQFSELSTHELHDIIKLRVDVFVVEQMCAYPELDGRDREDQTLHAMALKQAELVGYARGLAPEPSTAGWRIGRVVVAHKHRRTGLAGELMLQLINEGRRRWPDHAIELSAQTEVVAFYRELGFIEISDEYVEDGIPHIDMRRSEHKL